MTLTLIPAPITAVIAGRPAFVAGTLIMRFGRSTSAHSSFACAIVPSVSCARRGSTSSDTRPSTPFDSCQIGRKRSHARRTSSDVSVWMMASTSCPSAANDCRSAAYAAAPFEMAASKIAGFDVTPRTERSPMSAARFPESRRARLRSSSHTETPSVVRSCRAVVPTRSPLMVVREVSRVIAEGGCRDGNRWQQRCGAAG